MRSEGSISLKNPVTQPGIDPGTVRLVAQRLNYYATPGTKKRTGKTEIRVRVWKKSLRKIKLLDIRQMAR